MNYGFLSLVPPLLAIIVALRSNQVYLSLISGIFLGWIIVHDGNIWLGFLGTLEGLVDVFAEAGNTRTIMFSSLVGALIILVQRSGGVEGFIRWVSGRLKDNKGSRKKVQLYAWIISVVIFSEASSSILTVGSLFRLFFYRFKFAWVKLSYLVDYCLIYVY